MEEFYLDSCGAGRLHCALWKPEGEPKAVVQLIHGIAEHIGLVSAPLIPHVIPSLPS